MSRLAMVRRCLEVVAIIAALWFFAFGGEPEYDGPRWEFLLERVRRGWWTFATDKLPQYEIPWGQVGIAAGALVALVWGGVRIVRKVGGAEAITWATAARVTALAGAVVLAGIAFAGAVLQTVWLSGDRETGEPNSWSLQSVARHYRSAGSRRTSDELRRDAARLVAQSLHSEWDGVPRDLHIVCVDGPRGTDVLLILVDPGLEFAWIVPSTRSIRRVPRDRLREVIRDIEAGREPPKGEP